MLRELVAWPTHNRFWQSLAIIVTAIAQIVTARLTVWLHVGQGVEIRSALATHPLVPLGPAFAIWGAIYITMLLAAVWQALPDQKHNRALENVGWNMAAIGLINSVWQIWVPLNGFDWISTLLVVAGLIAGLSGLMRLREEALLSRMDNIMVFAPLALVTGWLTAAAFVNFTAELVAGGYDFNPVDPNISLGFLVGLVVFGGIMVYLTESLTYSLSLLWALVWVALANIYRDHEAGMVTTAVIGIAVVAAVCLWALTHHHESGPMQVRRG